MGNFINIAVLIATFELLACIWIMRARKREVKKRRRKIVISITLIALIIASISSQPVWNHIASLLRTSSSKTDSLPISKESVTNQTESLDTIAQFKGISNNQQEFSDTISQPKIRKSSSLQYTNDLHSQSVETDKQKQYQHITIGSDPRNAKIYIDNKFKGTTTKTILLPIGEHTIRLVSPESLECEDVIILRSSNNPQSYFHDFKHR